MIEKDAMIKLRFKSFITEVENKAMEGGLEIKDISYIIDELISMKELIS